VGRLSSYACGYVYANKMIFFHTGKIFAVKLFE